MLQAGGIEAALSELGRRGITSLFLEGGATLAAAFRAEDAIDEARTFVAPILLGGAGPRVLSRGKGSLVTRGSCHGAGVG